MRKFILLILAAILVPSMLGYVRKAKYAQMRAEQKYSDYEDFSYDDSYDDMFD